MSEKLFVRIPANLLFDPGLSAPEKILLALAGAFSKSGGLKMNNLMLGKILGLNQSTVSRLIGKLHHAGRVKISGGKTGHRKIFCAQAGGDPGGSAGADDLNGGGEIDGEKVREMMRSMGLG